MLTNSLSLDDEEAVQRELRALQQEAVSTLCLISKQRAHRSLIDPHIISYLPRETRICRSTSQKHLPRRLYLRDKLHQGRAEDTKRKAQQSASRYLLRPVRSTGDDPCLALPLMHVSYEDVYYSYHRARPETVGNDKKQLEVLEFPKPDFLFLRVLRYDRSLWWPLQVEIFPNATKSGTTSRCAGSILRAELDPEPIHPIAWLLFYSCWLATN